MQYLALVRHGQSEWNVKGLWTGKVDVNLTPLGQQQAEAAGNALQGIHFDHAFSSAQKRSINTLTIIKRILDLKDIPTDENAALNERDYGDLTGKNKWDIQKEFGEEQFLQWRRGWDTPPPGGESLKDVYHRTVPYFQHHIEPLLAKGESIIVAASGNSLRAVIKYIEHIPDDKISSIEINTGEVFLYTMDGIKMLKREIRASHQDTV